MPFPFALSRFLLLILIVICHVASIVISMLSFVGGTGGPFEAVAVVSSIISLLVFPITLFYKYINQNAEASNTRSLVTFGSLWLSSFGFPLCC
ncbi:hypothetical protein BV22DRAFT_42675 [Leucogyrophana mollusca]|uniref:Uncharacterized protein n=1 Tax=Leucogyrophana mollusca TaxID=85980 RepID=A0ACB8C118_9AGAM|nr:hypothetical protein BV22DRAFT_42675 [Leucogyrophana mollusca]